MFCVFVRNQRIDDALRQLTRIFFKRFGQLHRDVTREITVRSDLRAFQDNHCASHNPCRGIRPKSLGESGFQGRDDFDLYCGQHDKSTVAARAKDNREL